MTAPPDPAMVTQAYGKQTAATREQLLALLAAMWLGLGSWRDRDIANFQRTALPAVAGAQRLMGSMTDAYLSRMIGTATKGIQRPVGVATGLITGTALRGVPPSEVYERPFQTVWTALNKGTAIDAAVRQGANRLRSVASTDLQLAKTHTTQQVLSRNPRVTGYMRVPDATACALCLVASTQRYHKADLLPIHPGCGCDVEPIVDGSTDQVINRDLLNRIHSAVREQFGANNFSAQEIGDTGLMYRDLIVTHHHGELGPIIAVRGQHFDGPSSIAA